MQLLTKQLRRKLPMLGSQPLTDAMTFYAKIVVPGHDWCWYVAEWDGVETFFGLTSGYTDFEMGKFSLTELHAYHGDSGEPVTYDPDFHPVKLGELRTWFNR